MLRGLTTVSFFAADLDAARAWYSAVLGIEPYYVRPGYLEFRVGDYLHELGIVDSRYSPHPEPSDGGPSPRVAGAVIYWHVDDVAAARERLLSMGAVEHQGIIDRGEGFLTASVVDPFGNVLGVMYNPHYLDVLSGRVQP
jgi:catechol 2,3-dioxygenase-like lactoylglutathione lyase family enzyme